MLHSAQYLLNYLYHLSMSTNTIGNRSLDRCGDGEWGILNLVNLGEELNSGKRPERASSTELQTLPPYSGCFPRPHIWIQFEWHNFGEEIITHLISLSAELQTLFHLLNILTSTV